ncbi:MAG: pentapeptide repeat-containing protein [Desulfobacteraceae bacterium]|nr:pentapeptide repeat-containing protein [Desulfobacteraceae bacterium]
MDIKKVWQDSSRKALFILMACLLSAQQATGQEAYTVKENLEILLKSKSCIECDLSNANMNRLDLSGVELEGANLQNSTFFFTNLSNANLKRSQLHGTVFAGSDLSGADLREAEISGANFNGAYTVGTLFKREPKQDRSQLPESVMNQKDDRVLTENKGLAISKRRDFEESPPAISHKKPESQNVIDKPKYSQSKKVQTKPDISGGPLAKKPHLIGSAKLDIYPNIDKEIEKQKVKPLSHPQQMENEQPINDNEVEQPDIIEKKSSVKKVYQPSSNNVKSDVSDPKDEKKNEQKSVKDRLVEILLKTKKCYGCELSGVDVHGRDLEKADLESADLSESNLTEVDLRKANLKNTSFYRANLQGADLRKADLYRADFREANLTGANLKDAKVDNTQFEKAIGVQLEVVLQSE